MAQTDAADDREEGDDRAPIYKKKRVKAKKSDEDVQVAEADDEVKVRYPGGDQGRAMDRDYKESGNVPYNLRPGYDLAAGNAAIAAASKKYKGR